MRHSGTCSSSPAAPACHRGRTRCPWHPRLLLLLRLACMLAAQQPLPHANLRRLALRPHQCHHRCRRYSSSSSSSSTQGMLDHSQAAHQHQWLLLDWQCSSAVHNTHRCRPLQHLGHHQQHRSPGCCNCSKGRQGKVLQANWQDRAVQQQQATGTAQHSPLSASAAPWQPPTSQGQSAVVKVPAPASAGRGQPAASKGAAAGQGSSAAPPPPPPHMPPASCPAAGTAASGLTSSGPVAMRAASAPLGYRAAHHQDLNKAGQRVTAAVTSGLSVPVPGAVRAASAPLGHRAAHHQDLHKAGQRVAATVISGPPAPVPLRLSSSSGSSAATPTPAGTAGHIASAPRLSATPVAAQSTAGRAAVLAAAANQRGVPGPMPPPGGLPPVTSVAAQAAVHAAAAAPNQQRPSATAAAAQFAAHAAAAAPHQQRPSATAAAAQFAARAAAAAPNACPVPAAMPPPLAAGPSAPSSSGGQSVTAGRMPVGQQQGLQHWVAVPAYHVHQSQQQQQQPISVPAGQHRGQQHQQVQLGAHPLQQQPVGAKTQHQQQATAREAPQTQQHKHQHHPAEAKTQQKQRVAAKTQQHSARDAEASGSLQQVLKGKQAGPGSSRSSSSGDGSGNARGSTPDNIAAAACPKLVSPLVTLLAGKLAALNSSSSIRSSSITSLEADEAAAAACSKPDSPLCKVLAGKVASLNSSCSVKTGSGVTSQDVREAAAPAEGPGRKGTGKPAERQPSVLPAVGRGHQAAASGRPAAASATQPLAATVMSADYSVTVVVDRADDSRSSTSDSTARHQERGLWCGLAAAEADAAHNMQLDQQVAADPISAWAAVLGARTKTDDSSTAGSSNRRDDSGSSRGTVGADAGRLTVSRSRGTLPAANGDGSQEGSSGRSHQHKKQSGQSGTAVGSRRSSGGSTARGADPTHGLLRRIRLLPVPTDADAARKMQADFQFALFADHSKYVVSLLQPAAAAKLACLMRISPADLELVLAQPQPEQLLDVLWEQHGVAQC